MDRDRMKETCKNSRPSLVRRFLIRINKLLLHHSVLRWIYIIAIGFVFGEIGKEAIYLCLRIGIIQQTNDYLNLLAIKNTNQNSILLSVSLFILLLFITNTYRPFNIKAFSIRHPPLYISIFVSSYILARPVISDSIVYTSYPGLIALGFLFDFLKNQTYWPADDARNPSSEIKWINKGSIIDKNGFKRWISNDLPISSHENDIIGDRQKLSEEITKKCAGEDFYSAGIIGEFGTGKSSLVNSVEDLLKKKNTPPYQYIIIKISALGVKPENIVINIIEELIYQLSFYVDVCSVATVPQEFMSTLYSRTELSWISFFIRSSKLEHQLQKLDILLFACKKRALIVIEDVDRQDSQNFVKSLTSVANLIDHAKHLRNFRFLFCLTPSAANVENERDRGIVNELILRVLVDRFYLDFYFSRNIKVISYLLQEIRNEKLGKDILLPKKSIDDESHLYSESSEIRSARSTLLPVILESISSIRELKCWLREVSELWAILYGEVPFNDICVFCQYKKINPLTPRAILTDNSSFVTALVLQNDPTAKSRQSLYPGIFSESGKYIQRLIQKNPKIGVSDQQILDTMKKYEINKKIPEIFFHLGKNNEIDFIDEFLRISKINGLVPIVFYADLIKEISTKSTAVKDYYLAFLFKEEERISSDINAANFSQDIFEYLWPLNISFAAHTLYALSPYLKGDSIHGFLLGHTAHSASSPILDKAWQTAVSTYKSKDALANQLSKCDDIGYLSRYLNGALISSTNTDRSQFHQFLISANFENEYLRLMHCFSSLANDKKFPTEIRLKSLTFLAVCASDGAARIKDNGKIVESPRINVEFFQKIYGKGLSTTLKNLHTHFVEVKDPLAKALLEQISTV